MISMKRNHPGLFFLASASAAVSLAAALATDTTETIRADASIEQGQDNDDDDGAFYIPHEGNSTLSATFSMRVTPEHYHMFSWTILWLCFASAVSFGMHQIRLERRWMKHTINSSSASSNNASSSSSRLNASSRRKQQQQATGSPSDPELGLRKNYTRSGGGRLVRSSSRVSGSRDRLSHSVSSQSISNSSSSPGTGGEESHAVSTGDLARAKFRRILLFAIMSRTIAIPIQIYSDPLWLQLIADTFPVMAFATAWTWLLSFFVQLVGVALGTTADTNLGNAFGIGNAGGANNTSASGSGPSAIHRPVATIDTVIQITAYIVYAFLIITFTVFRRIAAAVLLYALLCCVYATLLGMGMYFCPRLLGLLLPGLGGKWNSPLVIRLVACSTVCLLVFAGHTLSFARKVVQSTVPTSHKGNGPYWWFQYGALELLPGILLLILLHPKPIVRDSSSSPSDNSSKSDPNYPLSSGRRTPPFHSLHRRTDSSDSKSGARKTPSPSPQPSRSPPPPNTLRPQQQQLQQGQQPQPFGKETTPLLSAHSAMRYGGGADNNSALPSIDQLTGSDRSANTS